MSSVLRCSLTHTHTHTRIHTLSHTTHSHTHSHTHTHAYTHTHTDTTHTTHTTHTHTQHPRCCGGDCTAAGVAAVKAGHLGLGRGLGKLLVRHRPVKLPDLDPCAVQDANVQQRLARRRRQLAAPELERSGDEGNRAPLSTFTRW